MARSVLISIVDVTCLTPPLLVNFALPLLILTPLRVFHEGFCLTYAGDVLANALRLFGGVRLVEAHAVLQLSSPNSRLAGEAIAEKAVILVHVGARNGGIHTSRILSVHDSKESRLLKQFCDALARIAEPRC